MCFKAVDPFRSQCDSATSVLEWSRRGSAAGAILAAVLTAQALLAQESPPTQRPETLDLPSQVFRLSFEADSILARGESAELRDPKSSQKLASAKFVEQVDGYRGKALKLNGTSSVIFTQVRVADARTIAFWVKPQSLTEPFILLSFHGSRFGFSVRTAQDKSNLAFVWSVDEKWRQKEFPHRLVTGQWQHVMLSVDWDQGRMSYVLDGDPIAEVAFDPPTVAYESKLSISSHYMDEAFEGMVDEFQVSPVAMSAKEMSDHYRGASGAAPGPIAGRPFSETEVTSANLVRHITSLLADFLASNLANEQPSYSVIGDVASACAALDHEKDTIDTLDLVRTTKWHRIFSKLRMDAAVSAADAGHVALATKLAKDLEGNQKALVQAKVAATLVRTGQRQSAADTVKSAIANFDPTEIVYAQQTAEEIAYVLSRLGSPDEALTLVDKFAPPDNRVISKVVEGLVDAGDLQTAEQILPRLRYSLFLGEASLKLSKACADRGKCDRAVKVTDAMYEDPPTILHLKILALGCIAGAYKRQNEPANSLPLLQEADTLADHPAQLLADSLKIRLMEAYLEAGRPDMALEIGRRIKRQRIESESPDPYLCRDSLAQALGQVAIKERQASRPEIARTVIDFADEIWKPENSISDRYPARAMGRAYFESLGSTEAIDRIDKLPKFCRIFFYLGVLDAVAAKTAQN